MKCNEGIITRYRVKMSYLKNYLYFSSKDVRLPVELQRAMAAEAEATREARAKLIAAEGELKASTALMEASSILMESPAAMQLRYLQAFIVFL